VKNEKERPNIKLINESFCKYTHNYLKNGNMKNTSEIPNKKVSAKDFIRVGDRY
jgi:hypothetical protein